MLLQQQEIQTPEFFRKGGMSAANYMADSLYFDFYGITLQVECSDSEAFDNIKRDSSYFLRDYQPNTDIKISLYLEAPPFDKIPVLRASLYNPDSISYDDGEVRYVDYQGRGLSVYDYKNEIGKIYTADRELLHELSYLLIHSRIGELLDRKGIHRIHALGISYKGKGVLCLLPQGAGKTTLALELLKLDGIKLLSDDIVLVRKDGTLLAFPLRLGVSEDYPLDIASRYLRTFKRRKYGAKTLIDVDYFKDRIALSVKPYAILIGQRIFSEEAKIIKISRIKAIGPLIRDAVIGLGLPQMVEYFLRWNIRDIFAKIIIACSRAAVGLKVLGRSRTYYFLLGRDKIKNSEIIIAFLRNHAV